MYYYKKKRSITTVLITITLISFIIQFLRFPGSSTSSVAIYESGGILGSYFTLDQSYRLITPIFVHIGIVHLVMNMLTLYFTGPIIEEIYGKSKYIAIYLICGIIGNAMSATFSPDAVSAGASTSLFGLFGILAMISSHKSSQMSLALSGYWNLIIINLLMNLTQPSVSLSGHLGGLLGGIACYYVFRPNIHV